jgi:hypothetical protein
MTSQHWICLTCGVRYPQAVDPPPHCPICEDERQFVRPGGQAWTTAAELAATHRNVLQEEEPGVWSIRTEPTFGIGQRAFLVQTAEGNLLCDSISLVDTETVQRIRELGGVGAIAVSHPHYYSSMAAWSEAFGGAPIWIHADDREWVMEPSHRIHFWTGERADLFGGISLLRSGGHFAGYQVGVWPSGAGGKGVLFAGDQPQVCLDGKWVTFMYSYPNWIPFGPSTIQRIAGSMDGVEFDRLYGAFGRHLLSDAKLVIARSVERYVRAIAD